MRKLFSVVIGLCLSWQGICFANNSQLGLLEQNGGVLPGSSLFSRVYGEMQNRGILNLKGHSMAAAVLATCSSSDSVSNRLGNFFQILGSLPSSHFDTIRLADPNASAQITYAAATLACKAGGRFGAEMVAQLDTVYGALLNDQFQDWLPNVVVAAQMVGVLPPLVEALKRSGNIPRR